MKLKRFLASFLSAAMVLTCTPVSAWQAGVASAEDVTESGDSQGEQIRYTVNAWLEGVTVTADSEEDGTHWTDMPATAAYDGDVTTHYHSNYNGVNEVTYETDDSGNATLITGNNNLYLALPAATTITGVYYVPRIDSNGNVAHNGAITQASIYISKDQGATYTLAKENYVIDYTKEDGTSWSYYKDGAIEILFDEPEADVTNVKIEVKKSASVVTPATPNQYINAAEIGALYEKTLVDERQTLPSPNLTVAAPTESEEPQDVVGDSYTAASVQDVSENPVTLTPITSLTIDEDGAFGGQIKAEGSEDTGSKLNVNGTTPFVINFSFKTDQPSDTQYLIGKMDKQYGVEITATTLDVYCNGATGSSVNWPTLQYNLPEGFDWTAWHKVSVVFTGSTFVLDVDGTITSFDGTVVLQSTTNLFSIGYNSEKSASTYYTGKLKDVVMYSGDKIELSATSTDEQIQAAVADLAPILSVKATPASGIEPDYDVTSTVWTDEDGKKVTTFEKGVDYTVTVTLTAKNGYKFTETASTPNVTADGEKVSAETIVDDNVTKQTSVMTVSYTFTAPAEEKEARALKIAEAAAEAALASSVDEEGNFVGDRYTTDDYTAESIAAYKKAYEDLKKASEESYENLTAAQVNALITALQDAKAELKNARIAAPSITFTAPVAGQYPQIASITDMGSETGAHEETIAELTEEPAEMVQKSGTSTAIVEQDGIWAFNTQIGSTSYTDKFDVYGSEAMAISLKLFVKKSADDDNCVNILGKMDYQYGFQLGADRLLIYMRNASSGWPEQQYQFDASTFYNTWHDVIIYIDGAGNMKFYVDGNASSQNTEHASDATAAHADNPFTLGYNPAKSDSTMFTEDYGYLADVKFYRGDGVSDALVSGNYNALQNMLDVLTPTANFTVAPYDTKTTWSVTGGDALDGQTKFAEETSYTATTVFTAHDGYVFTEKSKEDALVTADVPEGLTATVTKEISEDEKTMTVSVTYSATAKLVCSCDITAITQADSTITLDADEAAKTLQLNPRATTATGCPVDGHPNTVSWTYAVKDGADVVSVSDSGLITTKKTGEATITVTGTLAKRDGDEAATLSKDVKITVTSKRADEAAVTELENKLAEVKASIDGEKEALYTAESVEALKAAIQEAEDLLAKKPAISADEVKAALAKVEAAGLVEKEQESETNAPETDAAKDNTGKTPEKDSSTSTPVTVAGQTYDSGDYYYKVINTSDKTAQVVGLKNKKLKKVTVYSSVVINGENYKVIGVGANAFKNNKKITAVTIKKNTVSIGKNAFAGCTKLKKVMVKSKTLKTIGAKAFYGCKSLKTISLKPDKALKSVGKNAFKGISKKAVIKVPAAKRAAYKKLLAKKGLASSVKIK